MFIKLSSYCTFVTVPHVSVLTFSFIHAFVHEFDHVIEHFVCFSVRSGLLRPVENVWPILSQLPVSLRLISARSQEW